MIRRHLILGVVVPAMTAAAVVAPGASARPIRDGGPPAARMHHSVRSAALVDAAAHAATMRAIGAARVARASA
jgi:hypothetical protein